jgi:hypothetical protein
MLFVKKKKIDHVISQHATCAQTKSMPENPKKKKKLDFLTLYKPTTAECLI